MEWMFSMGRERLTELTPLQNTRHDSHCRTGTTCSNYKQNTHIWILWICHVSSIVCCIWDLFDLGICSRWNPAQSRYHILPKTVSPESVLCALQLSNVISRYWALAIPTWLVTLVWFIFISFMSINLMSTAPLDSYMCITGKTETKIYQRYLSYIMAKLKI